MSNLSQFLGGIKSIQRGQIGCSGGTSGTATITAVDTTKSRLSLTGYTTPDTNANSVPKLVLTNSTTVTVTAAAASNATATFQVIEHY